MYKNKILLILAVIILISILAFKGFVFLNNKNTEIKEKINTANSIKEEIRKDKKVADAGNQSKTEKQETSKSYFPPIQLLAKAKDTERRSEINNILSALMQYKLSPFSKGELPHCKIDNTNEEIAFPKCNDPSISGNIFDGAKKLGKGEENLNCTEKLIPLYLNKIPIDPFPAYNEADTGYWVCEENNKIYVIAASAEVYNDEGGCFYPGDPKDYINQRRTPKIDTPAMCVSG